MSNFVFLSYDLQDIFKKSSFSLQKCEPYHTWIYFYHLPLETLKCIISLRELSVDGRLLDMEDFYNTLFSEIESLDFSVTPINADLEGDAFRVESLTNSENDFILNVIYC